ncbi:MAG: aldo/keto reductase [Oscillospiraceae bacterium]|nr:aldo/keto reductase [Oscillospiraceae bacterium]
MQYRKDKYGNDISALAFGCMRFKKKMGKFDFAEAEREILAAYKMGVNYFDTAYIYPGNEVLVGEIFEKNNLREKINIATKLPHYLIKTREDLDRLFNEQLSRLRTDYIDYYLMHMLTDTATWERLCGLGIKEWIAEKKASGKIRQIGFSYHGNSEMFCSLVDVYDWDFCMIQYNYMDEHTQAGRTGLLHANKKGLPVMIMEPLRGGKLVNRLPEEAMRIFREHTPKYTPAEWSFRWLWNQPEVTTVLSGMNSMEMLEENCRVADSARIGELTAADEEMLAGVVKAINAGMKVPCTGCRYCVPCPKGVDIPGVFAAYNRVYSDSKFAGMRDYFMCTAMRKNSTAASNCIGCGKCEQHCPQNIDIRGKLRDAGKELENPLYRAFRKIASWVIRF